MMKTPPRLDVVQTLRLAMRVWWGEFAPITLLGLLLLTLPSILIQLLLGPGTRGSDAGSAGTIAQTLLGVATMLYFCTVAFGVLAVLGGRRLDPRTFIDAGFRAARPGLEASLILAVGGLVGVSVLLAGQILGAFGALVVLAATGALLWAVAALMPAVPAAIAERRRPLDALKRALSLTQGNRGRLLVLLLLVGLALLPPLGLVNLVMFGPNATPQSVEAVLAALELGDPKLWIAQLVDLLISGMLACVPPVVYVQLVRLKAKPPPLAAV